VAGAGAPTPSPPTRPSVTLFSPTDMPGLSEPGRARLTPQRSREYRNGTGAPGQVSRRQVGIWLSGRIVPAVGGEFGSWNQVSRLVAAGRWPLPTSSP